MFDMMSNVGLTPLISSKTASFYSCQHHLPFPFVHHLQTPSSCTISSAAHSTGPSPVHHYCLVSLPSSPSPHATISPFSAYHHNIPRCHLAYAHLISSPPTQTASFLPSTSSIAGQQSLLTITTNHPLLHLLLPPTIDKSASVHPDWSLYPPLPPPRCEFSLLPTGCGHRCHCQQAFRRHH